MKEIEFRVMQVLKHNKDGSFGTQAKRKQVLMQACGLLADKFPGLKLQNLKERHCSYLVEAWKDLASAKTMLSHLRWLFRKVNKEHLLPVSNVSLGIKKRKIISNENKSWIGKNGINIDEKISEASKMDETVGLVLKLGLSFGLRLEEAALFKPHENIRIGRLEIIYGTKGGRKRYIVTANIENPDQEALIKELLEKIEPVKSIIQHYPSFRSYKNRHYYILKKCHITRKFGLTTHGLRHTFAVRRYEELAGEIAPVLNDNDKGSKREVRENTNKDKDTDARQQIARELGHGRSSVTSAYVGGKR